VTIDAAFSGGTLTVSLEDGTGGCQFPTLDAGGVFLLDYYYANCWGGFGSGDQVRQINVRLESTTASVGQLTLYGVGW
jgi:hypothetical protein